MLRLLVTKQKVNLKEGFAQGNEKRTKLILERPKTNDFKDRNEGSLKELLSMGELVHEGDYLRVVRTRLIDCFSFELAEL